MIIATNVQPLLFRLSLTLTVLYALVTRRILCIGISFKPDKWDGKRIGLNFSNSALESFQMENWKMLCSFKSTCSWSDLSKWLCLPKYSGNCKYSLDALYVLFNLIMPNGGATLISPIKVHMTDNLNVKGLSVTTIQIPYDRYLGSFWSKTTICLQNVLMSCAFCLNNAMTHNLLMFVWYNAVSGLQNCKW